MVLVQNWPFSGTFFFRHYMPGKCLLPYSRSKTRLSRQYTPGKCLLRYSRTKKPLFYAIKTRSSKSRKIDIFSKRLTHGFGPKLAIFPSFFFGNIGQENVFYDILERKNAFLCYKNKKFKKSKNWHFFKGVNPWFWSKNGPFSNSFFM